jgi:hypothetical protein
VDIQLLHDAPLTLLAVVISSLVAGNNVKTLLGTDYLVQSQCLIADATRTASPVNVRLAV